MADATATQVAASVEQGWRNMIQAEEGKRAPSEPRSYVYASGYRDCNRQMALEATKADQLPPFEVETLARFRRGNDRERDLINIQLTRVGQYADPQFTVQNQQESVILRDRRGRKLISGKKEGNIVYKDKTVVPFELKSWDFNLTARMFAFEDLFWNKWTRTGAYQLLTYQTSKEEENGIFILDRPALPRLLPVSLMDHMDKMEEFMGKAEIVADHIEAGTLPDFTEDITLCKSCRLFGIVCQPPLNFGPGVKVETDEEFIAQVARMMDLEGRLSDKEWTEYNSLEKKVKARLRGTEMAVIGDYVMVGKWGKLTKYEIPDDVKKQYKVEDPKGKFTVKIEKLEGGQTDGTDEG